MRQWIIIAVALLAMTVHVAAQENDGFYSIKNEMDSMAESENMLVEKKANTSMRTCYFKYILNEEEMAQSGFVPEFLQRLTNAFDTTAKYSTESLQRGMDNIDMLPMKPLVFSRPDSFFGNTIWNYSLRHNFKYTCLQRGDTLCNRYLLLWENVRFTDSDGKPFACIDGELVELAGYDWRRIEDRDSTAMLSITMHDMMRMWTMTLPSL